MRVLVNAVSARMGGAVRHLPPFLEAIRRLHPDDEFVLARKPARMPRIVWDQWGVNREVARVRADVVLSLLNHGPIVHAVPHVLCQRNPAYYHPMLRKDQSLVRRQLAYWAMRRADRVVAPSEAMRAMILDTHHPGLDPAKVRVVYHGVDRFMFRPRHPVDNGDAPAGVAEMAHVPFRVLYVGHRAPWKDHEVLEDACRTLPVWLAIADNMPQAQVPALYRNADLFVYPSWGESFGLPMLEAMASGVPVLAADVPVNREVLSDVAEYFPVNDVLSLRIHICGLMNEPKRRALMASSGRERSAQFTWERSARGMMEILREVAR